MSLHNEIEFENGICAHLADCARSDDAAIYDPPALFSKNTTSPVDAPFNAS